MIRMKIRELRKARNWTLETLAREAKVPKSNLSEWETGKNIPTLRTLEKISKSLNVPVKDLFEEVFPPVEHGQR